MEYMHQIKTELFNITNDVRTQFRLCALRYSNTLDRMGQVHTNEMYTHGFFRHNNPYCKKVETLSDRIKYCGLIGTYSIVGENLADYPAEERMIIINPIHNALIREGSRPLIEAKLLCKAIVKGWYNSSGHRANLLCADFDSVGFGLLLYPKMCSGLKIKYVLVTQNFGKTAK